MNLGLVTDFYYPWVGGPAGVVHNLAQGLSALGHRVYLLAPSPTGGPYTEAPDGGPHVTRVRTVAAPFGYNLRTALYPRQEVDTWLERHHIELVHIHHPFCLSVTAALAARHRSLSVLATNHTIPECALWGIRSLGPLHQVASFGFARWLLVVLNLCRAVATPTRTAARLLHDLGFTRSIEVISNGVDTDRFAPGDAAPHLRRRLRLDDRPIVLYTGRLDPEKQMDVWLRAAAHARRHLPLQCVVGGQGTDRPRLERLAHELGMSADVRFIGYVPAGDLPDLYRLADAYLMTSPVELQSICTLEAVASGLPVVAVDAGALPELVEDNVNGHLVPPGCWEAAGDRLAALLSHGESRLGMSRHSRDVALRHDLSASVQAYARWLQTAAV